MARNDRKRSLTHAPGAVRGALLTALLAAVSTPAMAAQGIAAQETAAQDKAAQATAPDAVAAPTDTAPTALRDRLFRETLKHPTDVTLALAYVKACVALRDYEAAIGTLERVLFYAPDDANVKAQLGLLYAQLHSPQMARQYFDAALAGPGLDDAARAKIAGASPALDAANAGSHLFGSLQGGARSQSNAAFNPDNNILRLTGQDYVFTHPQDSGADGNAFGIAQIGYDYDLGTQRGDTVEARFTGYVTSQFHFTDLNVGLYDVSVGPRFALDALPGSTLKVYAAGGQVFLAGSRYLASGGGGVVADLLVRPGYIIEPGVEVRRLEFSNVSVYSSLNSGDSVTASVAGYATFNDTFGATARVFYTRDAADAAYQSTNNFAEELAVSARFAAPLPVIHVPWSVSPYVKLLQTRFDGPNPYIDSIITRRDDEIQFGLVLDTPVTAGIDVVTNIQEARVDSNIANYRVRNFSVLSGPTVRF